MNTGKTATRECHPHGVWPLSNPQLNRMLNAAKRLFHWGIASCAQARRRRRPHHGKGVAFSDIIHTALTPSGAVRWHWGLLRGSASAEGKPACHIARPSERVVVNGCPASDTGSQPYDFKTKQVGLKQNETAPKRAVKAEVLPIFNQFYLIKMKNLAFHFVFRSVCTNFAECFEGNIDNTSFKQLNYN